MAMMIAASALLATGPVSDDGRYANSPLKPWFDQLQSARGLCCSVADGFAVSDPDGIRRTAIFAYGSTENGSTFRPMQ